MKLDPSGKKLVYSTLLDHGGTGIYALAVDANGNAYVGGVTSSTSFPTTQGAFRSSPTPSQIPGNGYEAGFVSEFDSSGAKLLYSTLIGDPSLDAVVSVTQIAVDDAGLIRVIGEFGAEGGIGNFPFTANATYSSGPGFFTILSKTNPNLLYSTPLPLIPSPLTSALRVDGKGDSYIAADGLIEINFNGTIGYYAPSVKDLPLLVLSDGTAVVGGSVNMPNFPTRNTLMPCVPNLAQASASATFSGSLYDSATLTTFDPSGNITFSTLLSAPGGNTEISALSLDQNGNLYVIGSVATGPDLLYITGTAAGGQFPGGPIIDASSGANFAFMLDFSAVPQGSPAPSCLADAGHSADPYNFAPAAPGEIATLFGSNLGPAIGVQYQLNANGLVAAQLDDTSLTVGGVPAPILYAQDTQINFIVPQQISGSTTDVCVTRSGGQSCISAFTIQEWASPRTVASSAREELWEIAEIRLRNPWHSSGP